VREVLLRRGLRTAAAGTIVVVGLMASWFQWQKNAIEHTKEHTGQSTAYAERLLVSSREELNRADTKASILLAAAIAIIAAVVAGAVAGDWSPTKLTVWSALLWWVSTGLVGLAVLLLAGAVYPRTSRRKNGPPDLVAYYADVVRFSDHSALQAALEWSAHQDLDRLTDQVYHVCYIVRRKYRLIAAGMWTLLAATAGGCFAVLLQAWRS
jgi:hypothetical protein